MYGLDVVILVKFSKWTIKMEWTVAKMQKWNRETFLILCTQRSPSRLGVGHDQQNTIEIKLKLCNAFH